MDTTCWVDMNYVMANSSKMSSSMFLLWASNQEYVDILYLNKYSTNSYFSATYLVKALLFKKLISERFYSFVPIRHGA